MTQQTEVSRPVEGIVMLPCPHCGSEDIDATFWKNGNNKSGPGCMECGCTAESTGEWNRRKSKLDDLFRSMQTDAEKYLIPDNDCDRDWFVNRMLWRLDGPEQRKAQN